MDFKKLGIIFSSAIFLSLPIQVFAQDLTATPSIRRDKADQRIEDRQSKIDERKADIKTKRTEKQQQIVERMKEKLTAVIDKMNQMAGKLRVHVGKIRARANADTSKVETALLEAERHIGLAETEIASVKQKLSELDSSEKPKSVAQIFRTGVQSIHTHFKDARENLVAAVQALKDVAKETRPTKGAESQE